MSPKCLEIPRTIQRRTVDVTWSNLDKEESKYASQLPPKYTGHIVMVIHTFFFEFLLVFEICAWCSGHVLTRQAAGRPLFKTSPTVLLCRKAPTLLQPLPPCSFGISPT